MATDLGELTRPLDLETGFELEDPLLIELLIQAVPAFNGVAPAAVGLSGTTLSRDLSGPEGRLLVLIAVSLHLRGEWIKAAKMAIIHTNVAGRTDLTKVPGAFHDMQATVQMEIGAILADWQARGQCGQAQAHELGETLHRTWYGPGTSPGIWVWR